MKPIQVGLFSAVAVAVLFLVTPPETKAGLGESWRRFTGDPGQACFDFERATLDDPFSAKLIPPTVIADKSKGEVAIRFIAKNQLGANITTTASCIVLGRGHVDVAKTESLRKVREAEASFVRRDKQLDATIACLKDRISKRQSGAPVSAVPCPGQ